MKICSKCKNSKDEQSFPNDRNRMDGKYPWCRDCKKISDQRSYLKHQDSRKKKNHDSYIENKEDRRLKANLKRQDANFILKEQERSKKYRFENWSVLAKKKQIYYQSNKKRINEKLLQKRHSNINFRLQNNMRSRLSHALQQNTKGGKTIEYIGCSIEEFKTYIESKWLIGMSWDNYGKNGWHIDHVIPCCRFDFSIEDEIKKCFHFSNMQPLWAIDNMRKNKY